MTAIYPLRAILLGMLTSGFVAAGFWAREQMIKADLGAAFAEGALSPVLSRYQSADLYDADKQEQIKREMQELKQQLETEAARWRAAMVVLFCASGTAFLAAIWLGIRKSTKGFAIVALLGAMLAVNVLAADKEKLPTDVAVDQLPKGVATTVKRKFPDVKIQHATEVFSALDSRGWGLTVKSDQQEIELGITEISGSYMITRIAKPMEVKDLPKPVLTALDEKYPNSTIKSAKEFLSGNIEQPNGRQNTNYPFSPRTRRHSSSTLNRAP
jgi:hypothetical protein